MHCSCVTHIHSAQRRNKCKYNSFQNGCILRSNCIMHTHLRERNYSYLIPNPHELEFIIHIWLQSTKTINSINGGSSVYSFPYVQYIHVRKKLSFDKKGVESLYVFELILRFDENHLLSCSLNSTNTIFSSSYTHYSIGSNVCFYSQTLNLKI